MSNDADWIAQIARDEAEKVLTKHTVPEHPVYFFEGRWLVTFDMLQAYMADITELRRRIAVLERPWWRRWRNR